MIELAGVVKRFGAHVAVDRVDLTIEAGRTSALIGPSGCGKSTLLRVMIGLVRADAGSVAVESRPIERWDLRALRRRFGYAIQSGGLFPHLTAEQNVALPGRAHGMPVPRSRITDLCELMRIEPVVLRRYPAELSGGQRQRVALMRALVLDPDVLLLDEPLGALDPLVRSELQHDLRELCASLGKTVVLVTHDLAEAAYLAPDDIVLMREGRIAQRGAFAELRRHPADGFVSRFIEAQTERVQALVSQP